MIKQVAISHLYIFIFNKHQRYISSKEHSFYLGYHAPIDVYLELNQIAGNPDIHTLSPDKSVNVCVGKEWYRFPNSFFLPDKK